MNFSSDSDFSDGSTGLSRKFHCSTPKKVLRRQTRHLSEVRILSPRMPESSGYVSPAIYSSREFLDKRSIMNNAEMPRIRRRSHKTNKNPRDRMSVQVPLSGNPRPQLIHETSKPRKNVTLDDECESLEPSFKCKICSKGFFHESAVRAHELLHTSTLPRKKFHHSENILNKYRNAHMDRLRNVPTEMAFQKFNLNLSHVDDEEEKQDKKYTCLMCGKNFSKKSSMRLHQTKRHIHTREFLLFL